jgi:hypothetical protein
MSVKVRPFRRGGWEVDIRLTLPDGRPFRERKKISVTAKSAVQRWGESRERELLIHGPPKVPKEVPTLENFAPRFLDGHARANRHKAGGIANKDSVLRIHLIPQLGSRQLDRIGNEDVERLKRHLHSKAVKTVNNVLTVLSTLLKKAVEWEVIDRIPCTIRLLKTTPGSIDFYDFEEYERMVAAAAALDP